MNTNVKEVVKNFTIDQVKVDGDSFKLIDNDKVVDMYVRNDDDDIVLVKSHAFSLTLSEIVWDLSHNCKFSGKIKRMSASDEFELTNNQIKDIITDATCTVKQVEILEGEEFVNPRWLDRKRGEAERNIMLYMLTNITLSEEGEELVLKLYARYSEQILSK